MRATRKALFITLILLATILPFSLAIGDPGWLTGWSYRKSHVIEGSVAGAQTDYQMKFGLDYGAGADSGSVIYLDSKCETDFGDIRFTSSDGTNLLDYWIEDKTDSDSAIIWVEIPNIPESPDTVTIYIYYGKLGESTTSNGIETFIEFDDFEDTDFSEWTVVGSVTRDNTHVKVGNYSAKCGTGSGNDHLYKDTTLGWTNIALGVWAYDPGGADSGNVLLIYDGASNGLGLQDYYAPNHYWKRVDGVNTATSVVQSAGWHKFEVRMAPNVVKGSIDGTEITLGTNCATLDKFIIGNPYADQDDIVWIDAYYKRKYVDPEPTHGDWGEEEEEPIPLETPANLFGAGFNASSPYVSLYWTSNLTGITLFEVQNSTDKISWETLGSNTTSEYHDFQVVNGTERYYRVRACNFTDPDWDNSTFTDINFETVYFIITTEAAKAGDTIIMGGSGIFWIILIILVPIVAYMLKKG